jgi:hypothetical protein
VAGFPLENFFARSEFFICLWSLNWNHLETSTSARTSGLRRRLIAQYLRRQIFRTASGSKLVIVFKVSMCLSQFARRPPNVDNLITRVLPSKTSYTNSCVTSVLTGTSLMTPCEWNFDLDKPRQKFHHSLKEHHKISNIPKFRCEML